MAYVTRRGTGGWSSVQSYSTYSNVISNYAAALQQAQEEADTVALQNKVLEYKNGTATYQDVVDMVKERSSKALPGSQKELDFKELLIQLDTYETDKNRKIKEAELRTKYAKGGISAQEELQIQKEMLQYYKEGSPEYSEQLSNIATATELASQEAKNIKLSEIQAQLSEGGVTVDEEISLYKQARDMAEKGTQEYAEFERKINEAKVRKEAADTEREANEKYVEMLDQFKDGGITNEENLAITRELLNIYKPGSEEYTQMKETEAKLLGAIADEAKSGSGKAQRAALEVAASEFSANAAKLEEAQQKFADGRITLQDYQQLEGRLLQQMQSINTQNPDLFSGSTEGELTARFQQLQELRNQVQRGDAVVVKTKSGQQIVPLSELSGVGLGDEEIIYDQFDKKGNPVGDGTAANVITIDDNGVEKKVIVGEGGKLQVVEDSGFVVGNKATYKPAVDASGSPVFLDYGTRTKTEMVKQTSIPQEDRVLSPLQQLVNYYKSQPNPPANKIAKLERQIAEGRTSVPEGDEDKVGISVDTNRSLNVGTPFESLNAGLSNAIKSPSTAKSIVTNVAKSAATGGSNISTAANIAKDIVGSYAQSKSYNNPDNPVIGKTIFGTDIKQGVIPGTKDYGITEALGIGKLVDWAKGLFGK